MVKLLSKEQIALMKYWTFHKQFEIDSSNNIELTLNILRQYETMQLENNLLAYLTGKCFTVSEMIANNK